MSWWKDRAQRWLQLGNKIVLVEQGDTEGRIKSKMH